MSQSKFVYFGKHPTNVCFNGTSFPVAPGDIIKCYPQFIEDFIPPKDGRPQYKQIPDSDPRKPRHTFGKTPFFMKPDPVGGLPVRSDSTPGPHLKDKTPMPIPPSPAIIDDLVVENPYDITEDKPKIESSTNPETEIPTDDSPKVVESTNPVAKVPTKIVIDDAKDDEVSAPSKEEIEDDAAAGEETDETMADAPVLDIPNKTALRKGLREDLLKLAFEVQAAGVEDPAFRERFEAVDGETTRGVVFQLLWEFYGYDQAE